MPCSSQLSPRPFRHHLNNESAPPSTGRILPFGTAVKRLPAHPRYARAAMQSRERGGSTWREGSGPGGPQAEIGERAVVERDRPFTDPFSQNTCSAVCFYVPY